MLFGPDCVLVALDTFASLKLHWPQLGIVSFHCITHCIQVSFCNSGSTWLSLCGKDTGWFLSRHVCCSIACWSQMSFFASIVHPVLSMDVRHWTLIAESQVRSNGWSCSNIQQRNKRKFPQATNCVQQNLKVDKNDITTRYPHGDALYSQNNQPTECLQSSRKTCT